MTQSAAHLQRLVDLAHYQGFLTYDQASEFLPDESSHSGHTIQLLELLEKANIRLVDGDHDIDCKISGIGAMKLKSGFVKKV